MKAFVALVVLLLPIAHAGPATEHCSGEAHTYVIEVEGSSESPAVSFDAAVGGDRKLRLIQAMTPYRLELTASRVVAMFASKPAGASLTVKLFGREGGKLEQLGSSTSAAPLILENAGCPEMPRAFGSF